MILGTPRSGTSWLGKAFDSHPDVILRHEPDTVYRHPSLPGICWPEDIAEYTDVAREYLHELMDIRTLKTSGQLPLFAKSYQSSLARYLRTLLVLGLHGADKVLGPRNGLRSLQIPDMIGARDPARLWLVMKSVSSLGRARLFTEALPGAHLVHIIRSPFGQVASVLRGLQQNRFEDHSIIGEVLSSRLARDYGLNAGNFLSMSLVEQLAWHWCLLNQQAQEDLAGLPNVRTARHMDLVRDPEERVRDIFAWCGLPWHRQTQKFLYSSTHYSGPELYYQVYRNGDEPLNRWRKELAKGDVNRILKVVKQTPVSKLYPELAGWAASV